MQSKYPSFELAVLGISTFLVLVKNISPILQCSYSVLLYLGFQEKKGEGHDM